MAGTAAHQTAKAVDLAASAAEDALSQCADLKRQLDEREKAAAVVFRGFIVSNLSSL